MRLMNRQHKNGSLRRQGISNHENEPVSQEHCSYNGKRVNMSVAKYGSGHEADIVLLPGFSIKAKPGNKTAPTSWPDPYRNSHTTAYQKSRAKV